MKTFIPRSLVPVVLAALFVPSVAARAAAPAPPTVTDKDADTLARGDLVVRKAKKGEDSAVVTGIIDIEADPATVWAALLDFDALLDENASLKSMDCYGNSVIGTTRVISCWYELRIFGTPIRYYNVYKYQPADSYLTYDLDANRESDLDRNHGEYQVFDISDGGSPRCRFVYVSEIDTGRNIPEAVEKMLTATSLRQFLEAIKVRAER
jgi:hypothetical protein